jgi:muramoyltetrapeptide carboxypeptidase
MNKFNWNLFTFETRYFIHKIQFMRRLIFLCTLITFSSYSQKKMITPPYLQKGDTVAIVSTARKNLEDNLKPTIDLLEGWGLKVKIGKTIGLNHHQLAGTDEQRAEDFQEQMDNPNIKAIWCVRGGYGTVRMIDKLDFSRFKENPKWIIGFSDVTVLHSHLNRLGVQSIHGIMPVSVPRASDDAKNSLCAALFGDALSYEIDCDALNHNGKATGELVGGNLSILYSLLGSPSAIDCEDKILFFEDLDEYLYHIDRMMMNMKRNGCLSNLKGIIIGSLTDMKDNEIPWGKNAYEIVEDAVKELKIPIVYNFPAGHIRDNRTLIFGRRISLEVTPETTKVVFL